MWQILSYPHINVCSPKIKSQKVCDFFIYEVMKNCRTLTDGFRLFEPCAHGFCRYARASVWEATNLHNGISFNHFTLFRLTSRRRHGRTETLYTLQGVSEEPSALQDQKACREHTEQKLYFLRSLSYKNIWKSHISWASHNRMVFYIFLFLSLLGCPLKIILTCMKLIIKEVGGG